MKLQKANRIKSLSISGDREIHMPSQPKKDYVSTVLKTLQDNPRFVVVGFTTTSHLRMEELRTKLRESSKSEISNLTVLKNSLFKVAFDKLNKEKGLISEAEAEQLRSQIFGQSAIMLMPEDWVGTLKEFKNFAAAEEGMVFKVGILDGQMYVEAGLKQLADLPSKDQLAVNLIMALKAPQSRLVYGLKFNTMKLANVIRNAADR